MRAKDCYPVDIQDTAVIVDRFVAEVFALQGSIFTPGTSIWNSATFAELKRDFIDQPDLSDGTFLDKLLKQLQGVSDGAIQLMAEAVFLCYMIASQVGSARKLEVTRGILNLMRHKLDLPIEIMRSTENGLCNTGHQYMGKLWQHVAFLLTFQAAWHGLPQSKREELLNDPWAFKTYILSTSNNTNAPMRMAIMHMVHPATFAIIISASHKSKICRAFSHLVPNVQDEDRQLLAISTQLFPNNRGIWNFYDDHIRAIWDPEFNQPKPPPVPDEPKPNSSLPQNDLGRTESRNLASLNAVAESLYLESTWLREVSEVLLDRRQIIFHGPPGTGKTFIARKLAETLTSDDRIRFLQFHSAYSYEDFIEGLRPSISKGIGSFEIKHGPLRQFATAAKADPTHVHILIIDEINRANLSRVLGELIFLLEYRDKQVTLPYSGDLFSLPPNLLIIGTMNTSDRSIAIFDAAVRRRFAFFHLAPDCDPIGSVLADWLEDKKPIMAWLAAVVDRANKIIASPDHAIGPAFFMQDDLSEQSLDRIWRLQVLPYLDEFLHDDRATRAKLELPNLRRLIEQEQSGIAG